YGIDARVPKVVYIGLVFVTRKEPPAAVFRSIWRLPIHVPNRQAIDGDAIRSERSAHRPYELSDLVGAQFELLLHRFDRSGRIGESQFDENGDGEHLKQPATTHEMPSNSK